MSFQLRAQPKTTPETRRILPTAIFLVSTPPRCVLSKPTSPATFRSCPFHHIFLRVPSGTTSCHPDSTSSDWIWHKLCRVRVSRFSFHSSLYSLPSPERESVTRLVTHGATFHAYLHIFQSVAIKARFCHGRCSFLHNFLCRPICSWTAPEKCLCHWTVRSAARGWVNTVGASQNSPKTYLTSL